MFITKKRFQEEIEKAKKEAAEEIYRKQEVDDRFRWMNEHFDRLEMRLWKLEDQLKHQPEAVLEQTCDPVAVTPACY